MIFGSLHVTNVDENIQLVEIYYGINVMNVANRHYFIVLCVFLRLIEKKI